MNITSHSGGGLSTLVPLSFDPDPAGHEVWQVLDEDGELLFSGDHQQAHVFMETQGLRPDCNCELVDTSQGADWYSSALGWA